MTIDDVKIIVDESYEDWIRICKNHSEHKDTMARQIGRTANGYFGICESYWLEKFKDEPIIIEIIKNIK